MADWDIAGNKAAAGNRLSSPCHLMIMAPTLLMSNQQWTVLQYQTLSCFSRRRCSLCIQHTQQQVQLFGNRWSQVRLL
jgi:hypothetical protein